MPDAINPADSPPALGPFSQGVTVEGRFVFVSGQGPQLPDGRFDLGDFAREVRLTLDNVTRVLAAAKTNWSQVVRVGVYLARKEDFAAFNAIYAEYAREPLPARTTIICTLLANISVEIDCVAAVPQ